MSDAIVSLPFHQAKALGIGIDTALAEHTRARQIVGALRRRDKLVSMIEVVVRPYLLDSDLMGNTPPDLPRLEHAIRLIGYDALASMSMV